MSNLHKSTPKMRKAFTPRVRSDQRIPDTQPKKALFFSNKNNDGNNMINPQKIENHLAKKLNLNVENQNFNKKIDIANLNTDTDSPIRRNNFIQKNQGQKIAKPLKKQQIQGRIKQWPQNNSKFNLGNNFRNNQQNKQISSRQKPNIQIEAINFEEKQTINNQTKGRNPNRCMSAHTFKTTSSASFSQKSSRIKQQKQQFQQKFNVAFQYLLRSNSQYLKQKLSMCHQKSRPKQQTFKIKRPSINTTNSDFYKAVNDKHRLDIQPQNQKMSLLLSSSKVCGNSTNQQIHSGKQGKKADLAEWPQGFKLQGPIYSITTKQNEFPNHGDFQKMVPVAVWNQHPLGMKHKGNSTSSKFFKGQFAPRANLATWNNLNPVSNDLFNPQNSTLYSKQFSKKQKQPIQQWPMPEHKLITTEGKFNTQFRGNMVNFNNHELNN